MKELMQNCSTNLVDEHEKQFFEYFFNIEFSFGAANKINISKEKMEESITTTLNPYAC